MRAGWVGSGQERGNRGGRRAGEEVQTSTVGNGWSTKKAIVLHGRRLRGRQTDGGTDGLVSRRVAEGPENSTARLYGGRTTCASHTQIEESRTGAVSCSRAGRCRSERQRRPRANVYVRPCTEPAVSTRAGVRVRYQAMRHVAARGLKCCPRMSYCACMYDGERQFPAAA
jgi:hypothetical protein